MHLQGNPDLDNLPVTANSKGSHVNYSDTKFHDVMLTMTVARNWPGVLANAVDPGWVPTKMGGKGDPDSLEKGYETQVWLAVSNEAEARVSGHYFHHKRQAHFLPSAKNKNVQEKLLTVFEKITGVRFDAEE